jgi:hypothetical protein
MSWSWLVGGLVGGLGLVLAGCGDKTSTSPQEPEEPCEPGVVAYAGCSCGDSSFGKIAFDACTDEVLGSCDCGEITACETEGFPCAASQRCFAEAGCEACACNPPTMTEPRNLDGRVVDMAADGAGGVLLLTGGAPWLVRITPDGMLKRLEVAADLAWATRVWHAPDGSIVVLGGIGNDAAATVKVERFDQTGAPWSTATWSPEPETGCNFLDMAVRPDGRLAVLAGYESKLAIGILDTAQGAIQSLHVTDFATDPLGTGIVYGGRVSDFAVGPDGDYFVAGSLYRFKGYEASWRLRFDSDGKPAAEQIDKAFDLFPTDPLLAGSEAGVFQAWTWRPTNTHPFASYYARLTPELGELWRYTAEEANDLKDSRATALTALPDGAVFAGTELGEPVLRRFDASGASMLLPVPLEVAPQHIVPVGEYQLAILEPPPMYQNVAYSRLTWLTLEPLRAP